eukprot:3566554-Pleurochrysis_carterae.AAC.6
MASAQPTCDGTLHGPSAAPLDVITAEGHSRRRHPRVAFGQHRRGGEGGSPPMQVRSPRWLQHRGVRQPLGHEARLERGEHLFEDDGLALSVGAGAAEARGGGGRAVHVGNAE